jgi:hypothetical protein
MKKNKKIKWIIAIILTIVIIFIGISFALFSITKIQTKENELATLCLDFQFEEDEDSAIDLEDAIPITDKQGLSSTPYTFTITNNCSASLQYAVNLDILTDLDDEDSLQLKYVKSSLNNDNVSLLSEYDDTTTNISGAYSSKELYAGILAGNSSKNFELRLWVDKDTPMDEGMDKYFYSKIVVTNTRKELKLTEYIAKVLETDKTSLVYDETDDNNLRYIGADPNNYLCFDKNCSNGEWRVIGIMNNIETESNGTQSLVKIIRADNVGKYAWDSNNVNDWDTSSLKDELNSGDLYETYIKGYDNLFESVIWNLGGWSSEYTTTSNWYTYERGTTVYSGRPTTWTGKIALMYPSDYGYATSGGSTTDRATCLSINMNNSYWGNSSYSNCKNNDYLYNSSYRQWTLTPYSSSSYGVFCVGYTGYVGFDVAYAYGGAVRPVGYLKSDLTILNGDGSSGNPWIISES